MTLKEWNEVKLMVLRRDNWRCRHCKARNKYYKVTSFFNKKKTWKRRWLHVHHINPQEGGGAWKIGKEIQVKANLLLTLCASCHVKQTHKDHKLMKP